MKDEDDLVAAVPSSMRNLSQPLMSMCGRFFTTRGELDLPKTLSVTCDL